LARKRLEASGWLDPVAREGNLRLYRLRGEPAPGPGPRPVDITSPVSAVWYAQNLILRAGRRAFVEQASGYALELEQAPASTPAGSAPAPVLRRGAQGNVIQVEPGQAPGLLAQGPGSLLPPGRYLARFRLQAGLAVSPGELGALEIGLKGQAEPLARRALTAADFSGSADWVDVPLPFALNDALWVEPRVIFSGRAPLALNLVLVGFAGQAPGPGVWEAEDLLRQGGVVAEDPAASGGQAVLASGLSPQIWIMHGPYQTLEPGDYRARFYLRAAGPGAGPVARVEAATDLGRRVFAGREVAPQQIAGPGYQAVELDFRVPFRCELDLRVRYLGGGDLWLDRVEVAMPPPRPGR
jgi:hypothetical protein